MHRSHSRTSFLAGLVIACAFARSADAAPERPIEKARTYEEKLVKDTARLKLRHNIDKLIVLWTEAKNQSKGAVEKKEAADGEARAWKLLAKWSGKPELAKPPAPQKAEAPKVEASKKTWLTKLELQGGKLTMHTSAEVRTRRELIPAKGDRLARLVFDLTPAVAASDAMKTLDVNANGVKRVRVGQFDADTARVVIDLEKDNDGASLQLEQNDGELALELGHEETSAAAVTDDVLDQIVADMKKTTEKLEAKLETQPEETPPIPAEVEPAPAVVAEAPAPAPALAAEPPLVESNLKASTREAVRPRDAGSILRIQRVVIDAGHGGKDFGAIGKDGVREKDVNLAIAQELGKQIEQKLGLRVVYTRTKDEFISLRKRTQIANKSNGDLFISIHANAHKKRSIAGIETYYLNTTSDRYAERLALRENAETSHEADAEGDDIEPGVGMPEGEESNLPSGAIGRDLRLILADLAMRSATTESRRLAGYVQSTLVGTLKRSYDDVTDLGVKHALFYVLLGPRMPSVLIETGFVTNPTEAARLNDAKYRREAASAIARGLARFIEERNTLARRMELQDETLASVRR